jgi:hypothetical protein
MKKEVVRAFKLQLRKRELKCRKLMRDGTPGKPFLWNIGEASCWPMQVFIPFSSSVVNAVNSVRTRDKDFRTVRRHIYLGLQKGAKLIGCTIEEKYYGEARLLLHGERFLDVETIDFMDHGKDEFLHEPNKKNKIRRNLKLLSEKLRKRSGHFRHLEKSSAMFRMAAVVLEGGLVWLVPARTKKEGH